MNAGTSLSLWLVDDTADHHRVAAATAACLPGILFHGFPSGLAAIDEFERLAQHRRPLPDVVLMDYFLGDERGDAVTAVLRELEPSHHHSLIVGYSSVESGSERIIAAGADTLVRKHADMEGVNPSLLDYLRRLLATR